MTTASPRAAQLDTVIEKGILFLLLFTPLVFGAVHDWSIGVMEMTAFLIFGAWLSKMALAGRIEIVKTPLLALTAALITLVALQLVPLPRTLLTLLTPQTSRIYNDVFGEAGWNWRTISIYPGATGEELLKLLAYAAIFFVIINHYRTKEQVLTILRTIVLMACFLVVFAVVQKLTWNGRLFWFYPIDPALLSRVSRIWGPYVNANHFAGYMEMAMPLSVGMLLYRLSSIPQFDHAPAHRKIASLAGSRRFPQVAAWATVAMVLSAAVFMTLSRGGILGLGCAVLFLTAMARTRRSLKKKIGLIAAFGAVIFLAVLFAGWERISDRFDDLADDDKVQRIDVWKDAGAVVRDFPVFGTGFGTFNSIYPRYQSKYSTVLFEHAENDYIESATDLGVPGALIIVSVVTAYLSILIPAWRSRRDSFVNCIGIGGLGSCVAVLAHSCTDFNMRIPANALLMTVIAGTTFALVMNVREKRRC